MMTCTAASSINELRLPFLLLLPCSYKFLHVYLSSHAFIVNNIIFVPHKDFLLSFLFQGSPKSSTFYLTVVRKYHQHHHIVSIHCPAFSEPQTLVSPIFHLSFHQQNRAYLRGHPVVHSPKLISLYGCV